jgi:hypothetical protein
MNQIAVITGLHVTGATYGGPMANSSGLSSSSDIQRVIDAARTPEWNLGPGRHGGIMATRDSGQIGLPWVVLASRAGKGMRIYKFHPGDDLEAEGETIGEIAGNPREMGRQLRTLLSDVQLDD